MADSNNFFDGIGQLFRSGADAYGAVMVARAQASAAANTYGGHGGGQYGVNADGEPEYFVDSPNVSASVPGYVILAGVAVLVYVLARR